MEMKVQTKRRAMNACVGVSDFLVRVFSISFGLSLVFCTAALARLGDVGEPIQIEGFPYIHSSTTAARDRSRIDNYGCAPATDESGPEVVYQFSIQERGVVTADVLGDGAGVDIDLHLLRSVSTIGRQAQDCLVRHNRRLSETLEQGTYFLIVDTYNGDAQAGDYRLSLKFQPEEGWYERPIAQGVILATKRYVDLFGGSQTASLLRVDSTHPNVEVRPILASTCRTTSDIAERAGAVAAINAGYFDGGCQSVSLIKIDGTLLAANARSRSAFGINEAGVPSIAWVPAGEDWQNAYHAVGGLSRLVRDGQVNVEWERDSADYGFTHYRNPRTGVAFKPTGEILLATLDGRTSAGIGVDLFDFAQWFVWLGASDALNLDGGGSTSLWTRSEGVVNFPSDNGVADHLGERRVNSVLAVFADPVQREVEWVVSPTIGRINAGERVTLEIFARDPDGEPVELRASVSGRGAHTFYDRGDGTAQFIYEAALDDFTEIEVGVRALYLEGETVDSRKRCEFLVLQKAIPLSKTRRKT